MHGSHDHGHVAVDAKNETRMGIAALITGAFMLIELAGGIVANSLALIADAGHMLTDFASLTLAWFAFRLARRPADWKRTYGFDRFQVLVAFTNGLALFVIAAWIVYEAIDRLIAGEAHVAGGIMVVIGVAGLLVNIVSFLLLRGADRENLNIRGAALHVLGDLLGSVAALAAGAVNPCSPVGRPSTPILSMVVALIILRSGWFVVSGRPIFLRAAGTRHARDRAGHCRQRARRGRGPSRPCLVHHPVPAHGDASCSNRR